MTNEKLKIALEIQKLIRITENGVKGIKEIIEGRRSELDNCAYKEDSVYSLSIFQYVEKEKMEVDISRYYGNERLLDVILKELEEQLEEFQIDFEKL